MPHRTQQPLDLKPWMLFVIVVAIVVPITAAMAFAGPGAGLLAAGVVGVAVVFVAIRLESTPRLGRNRGREFPPSSRGQRE